METKTLLYFIDGKIKKYPSTSAVCEELACLKGFTHSWQTVKPSWQLWGLWLSSPSSVGSCDLLLRSTSQNLHRIRMVHEDQTFSCSRFQQPDFRVLLLQSDRPPEPDGLQWSSADRSACQELEHHHRRPSGHGAIRHSGRGKDSWHFSSSGLIDLWE